MTSPPEVPELPPAFAATRETVHRVAAHVLSRRRHAVTGRIGLRATPGGLGTPAFGPGTEVVRVSGGTLLHERDGRTVVASLAAASLGDLVRLVGVDLDAEYFGGHDTPPVGDLRAPLGVDPAAVRALGAWFGFGAVVLDAAADALGAAADPSVAQLWPEHFDLAYDVAVGGPADGRRANVGASPGDTFSGEPYLYVGPFGAERPGDAAYWNAPFGAALGLSQLAHEAHPAVAAVAFLVRGVNLLRG